jgi:uncharacterized protein (TIGR02646 family)
MKKIIKSGEPEGLRVYREAQPQGLWEEFDDGNAANYNQVRQALFADQHGLCAYCEIDLIFNLDKNFPRDFRVEHFHPKEDKSTNHNWELDWQNLLAVCHGGQMIHAGKDRFSKPYTCDVPKHDKLLDDVIINPLLMLNSQTQLFNINSRTGELYVHHRCPSALISRASNTIQELNLNAVRLCNFRLEQITVIEDFMQQSTIESLLAVFLQPNQAFFSTIRAFFGQAAENHLKQIGYFEEATV